MCIVASLEQSSFCRVARHIARRGVAALAVIARTFSHAVTEHQSIEMPQRINATFLVRHPETMKFSVVDVERILVGIPAGFGHLDDRKMLGLQAQITLSKSKRHALSVSSRGRPTFFPMVRCNSRIKRDLLDGSLLFARERTRRRWQWRLVIIKRLPCLRPNPPIRIKTPTGLITASCRIRHRAKITIDRQVCIVLLI